MPETRPIKRRKPLKRAKLGGVTVTLQRLRAGRGFAVVVHMPDGTRQKREYPTAAEARTAFDLRACDAANAGAAAAVHVTDEDKRAVSDFKGRTANWTSRPTIGEALAFFLEHQAAAGVSQTVEKAVECRITDAVHRGLSRRHIADLESRLTRFSDAFGHRPLSTITSEEISDWIRRLGVTSGTQHNYKTVIGSLFHAAVQAGRLSRNPLTSVKVAKPAIEEPGTITPGQLSALLLAMPTRSQAVTAIQALAGLRAAEAMRLEWHDVKLDQRLIVVSAAKSFSGRVAPEGERLRKDMNAARTAAGITQWPQNALRHSCASAWTATEPDVARVAGWLGNAPAVVHRHYRALWTEAMGREWQAVAPLTSFAS